MRGVQARIDLEGIKMLIRSTALAVLGLIVSVGGNILQSIPAEAGRKHCMFAARSLSSGVIIADGNAWATKMSRSCRRAKRRCKRELARKQRGAVGERAGRTTGCKKQTGASVG